jgi:hypothetical protein
MLSLRGAFAPRQSATARVLDRIAASQVLLAMTMNGASYFDNEQGLLLSQSA